MKMDNKSEKYSDEYVFYKDSPDNKMWDVRHVVYHEGTLYNYYGEVLFSFDKETIFNAWTDYPDKLTPEQKEIFDKESPYWADFFSYRPYPKRKD